MVSSLRWIPAIIFWGIASISFSACGAIPAERSPSPGNRAHPQSSGPLASKAASAAPGDRAPHDTENNGWKQRHDLSPADRRAAEATAHQIRPALARLRKAGDFAPEAVLRTFKRLGLPNDRIWAGPMRTSPLLTSPTPVLGAVFSVRAGIIACVDGDVRPERVLVQVEGPDAEGNCIEPFSH